MHIDQLLSGERGLAVFGPQRQWTDSLPERPIVLPGSFRPIHRAHRALMAAAVELIDDERQPVFEISFLNVEKPVLAKKDILDRLNQFDASTERVAITRAATFVEKARIIPQSTFVIGYDTAIRLFDDRFYEPYGLGDGRDSPSLDAITEVRELGCDFVVGGRHDPYGDFKTLSDIQVPASVQHIFREIPEELFSDPISSTHIRNSQYGAGYTI